MAVFSVLRIHSETVWFLDFTAASIVRISSGVTLTRKVLALAAPFGSGELPALPAFFGFLCLSIPEFLYDCGPYRENC